jgi:outer membrane protein TolC
MKCPLRIIVAVALMLSLHIQATAAQYPATTSSTQRKSTANDSAKAREELITKIYATRADAEKLLLLYQSELELLAQSCEQKRAQYNNGLATQTELLKAEQDLAAAKLRVEEDKRSLAEMDIAITEFMLRDQKSR